MIQYVFPLLSSFGITALVTPLIIWWYKKKNWVDDPYKEVHAKKVHSKPTPRGGGWSIFIGVLIASLLFLPLSKHMIGILGGALILTLLGWLDDLYNVNPYLRLFLLFLPALFLVGSGIGIAYVSNPFGAGVIHLDQPQIAFSLFGSDHTIWILADIFAVVWVLWNMNVVNWSKGLDGQMPGFVGIAAVVIAILSTRFADDPTQGSVTLLAMIVAGAFFGFLLWNLYPQKMMAGFAAGTMGGYFLALLSILSGAKVATALLILAVPTIDAVYVIGRRLLSGKSPVWGDRGHLHHRLMDLGWGKRRIAFFYWGTTAFFGFLALQLNSTQKFYTILGVVVLFGGFVSWLALFFSSSNQLVRDSG
jgi:UDP-GlcNAc:undecaprenyl-phosphate GlcNAc-1-phosphate transferase